MLGPGPVRVLLTSSVCRYMEESLISSATAEVTARKKTKQNNTTKSNSFLDAVLFFVTEYFLLWHSHFYWKNLSSSSTSEFKTCRASLLHASYS